MNAVDLISRKREGAAHTDEELEFLVQGVTAGSIPDYQTAAWLMAVCWRGMTGQETSALTMAMARTGQMLALKERWPNVVDKHSTGGVGDKTTLVLAPMLAAAGARVAKMSGRGLGFSGGTVDKLESIPGMKLDLSSEAFVTQVGRIGLAISGQSADLAPADGKLYALRDVTATIQSIPLIASSVMSKKLALGASRLVLDVKVGAGAFMKTVEDARALARAMVDIGNSAGTETVAVLSEMSQPEGFAVGNALEVREAIATLRGDGPEDLLEVCLMLGRQLRVENLEGTIASGKALNCFREMVAAQGGDVRCVDEPDRLPTAAIVRDLSSTESGYVSAIDAECVARAALALGAGRAKKGDPIDPAVGVLLKVKVGDHVSNGQCLAELHLNDATNGEQAMGLLSSAFRFSTQLVARPSVIKEVVS